MKGRKLLLFVLTLLLVMNVALPLASAANEKRKVEDAGEVLRQIMAIPEKGIPPALLGNAQGIIIIPGLIKAAFIVGGRYGTGVMLARTEGDQWSDPVFVSIAGGSVGWQIGATSTDIILVLKSRKSIEGILKGKFTLGADAAVAAGPVGRNASAATDVTLKSEILSYSRSRGLFAGLSLEGATLLMDNDANALYYGKKEIKVRDILSSPSEPGAPAEAKELQRLLKEYAGRS